ncbi:hypothetical protein GGR02_003500 [Anoxybacillus voinovskiensis]|uniref:Uncharacterized protein n=1 Tax=Anoxybacteroides voinovskiense TaxID=230470 RepID=A0A840E377_9BACL|nr:hypothetical protein [Anoxybacillus voinovskiensis]MBB4075646.1 hypothetical protein [Anoxybacillus voinovskiensis]GGJ81233.1 hypothetical protein GCM10008982_33370 [Anoxybacillus voinovskiensis]
MGKLMPCLSRPEEHVSFLSEELFTDVTAGEKYRVDLLVETKLKGEDSRGFGACHLSMKPYETMLDVAR